MALLRKLQAEPAAEVQYLGVRLLQLSFECPTHPVSKDEERNIWMCRVYAKPEVPLQRVVANRPVEECLQLQVCHEIPAVVASSLKWFPREHCTETELS